VSLPIARNVSGKKISGRKKIRAPNFEIKTGQKKKFGYKLGSDQTLMLFPDVFGNRVGTQNRTEVKICGR